MKSFRLGSSMRAASIAVVGVLAVTGCPSDDTGDSGNDSLAATSEVMTDSGMESTTASMDTSGGTALSHDADIQPIWEVHCLEACHETGGEWSVLDMSGSAYDAIVGAPAATFADLNHVEPGDLELSYLWHKINDSHLGVGGNGVAMPKARVGMSATVLTADELSTIQEWIEGGANP
jgi:hypothetical protein